MNKKISFPIAIIIIVVCAVLAGGFVVWQYWWVPKITEQKGLPPSPPVEEPSDIKIGEGIIMATLGGVTLEITEPIDIEITDPDGLVLNKEKQEIPNSIYSEEDINGDGHLDDNFYFRERKIGDYKIKVIPEPGADPEETFSLEINVVGKYGYTPISIVKNATIGETSKVYVFKTKQREETHIKYEGDLQAKYMGAVNLKATLTDFDGNPLPDKEIEFTFTQFGDSVTVITDSNGIASTVFVLKEHQKPTEYEYIDFKFLGDQDYMPAIDSKYFEILKP